MSRNSASLGTVTNAPDAQQNPVAAATRRQAARRQRRQPRLLHMGAATVAHPCRKNRAGRGALLVAGTAFGLHDGYWGSISAIIVLQSNSAPPSPPRAIASSAPSSARSSAFLFALRRAALELHPRRACSPSSSVACWACAAAHAWPASPSPSSCWSRRPARTGALRWIASCEVLLGIVVALAVTTLVFPDRARAAPARRPGPGVPRPRRIL